MSDYDSAPDTLRHSRRVGELVLQVVQELQHRAVEHDLSKLEDPEKSTFDTMTPQLQQVEYGSDAYRACLVEMQEALRHHYAHNRHHPEHFEDGIAGMTLVDVMEMLADWKAATERTESGDLSKSLSLQRDRFAIDGQLDSILWNTALVMGWV